MFRSLVLAAMGLTTACGLTAETYRLTLKQAIGRAMEQNPDLTMARLDEHKAAEGIRVARDPFVPRLSVGSGLAYTNGYPQSVEGSAPSLINARADEFIFNRQQTYIIAQARENARGAGYATGAKRDEIAFRTASLYLDVDRAARMGELLRRQVDSLTKVAEAARSRVEAGYELPIEAKRAMVELKRAEARLLTEQTDEEYGERSLAVVLGYTANDHVETTANDFEPRQIPATETAALDAAFQSNKNLRRLQSEVVAKGIEVKADKAQRLPRADLVAQYALFSRFNNIDEYFTRFQKNNEEIGMSFSVPLLPGPGIAAQVAQAEDDAMRARTEFNAARNQITLNVHQAYQNVARARMAKDVASADLDLARDSVTVLLSQMNEGRASLRQVEEARFTENEKWLAFYDAEYEAERAELTILRETGELAAVLR